MATPNDAQGAKAENAIHTSAVGSPSPISSVQAHSSTVQEVNYIQKMFN